MLVQRTRSEMDITTDFGSVIEGSTPSGCTRQELFFKIIYNAFNCGHSLVVEQDLAKIQARFRLPLAAQIVMSFILQKIYWK